MRFGEEEGKMSAELTARVKAKAMEWGADLVGIASVDRFKFAPERFNPRNLLPEARAVVVVAVHHPDACIEHCGEPTPHHMGAYAPTQEAMNWRLDFITFMLSRMLEEEGFPSLPLPVTNIWQFRQPEDVKTSFVPDFPHIHAGAAAGLGEIGWSGLLLTPEFGPRQRVSSLLTAAPLIPDPLYEGPPLCDRCMVCVRVCPVRALSEEVERIQVRIGDRKFEYPLKNKWRCAWAEHFGLSFDLEVPSKVDERAILKLLAEHGRRGGEMGWCLKFCLPPHLREGELSTKKSPRRRRGRETNLSPRQIFLRMLSTAWRHGVDIWAVLPAERWEGVDNGFRLPEARCGVVVKADEPEDELTKEAARRRAGQAALDIARELEALGFPSLPFVPLPEGLSVDGIAQCVLTVAPLEEFSGEGEEVSQVRGKPTSSRKLTEDLRALALGCGADLFGVAPASRLEEIVGTLNVKSFEVLEAVDEGLPHGPVKPKVWKRETRPRGPSELLEGAKSVVVVGVRMPSASLSRAREARPAIAGFYAHAHYATLERLKQIALELGKLLSAHGFAFRTTFDLVGLATEVASPRGRLTDFRGNALAAVAAGLGEIGWHGAALTPEFGIAQRFVAIVTDAELEPDPLYEGPRICQPEECGHACVKACPVNALSPKEAVKFEVEGRVFEFGRWEAKRCDWAKKFGLVGEEGPSKIGSLTDIPPPEEVTLEALREALRQLDPVQKHWLCVAEPCFLSCHSFLMRGRGR